MPAGSVVAHRGWHRKWEECGKISSSVHGALAELIGEVSRRDGGVRKYLFNQSEPPRHFVPLPLCAPQTGGDNIASRRVVAHRGWHRKWEECSEISSSVHGASAELIGEVSRRDGGVRDRASTPSSRCATPPICSANRGRQSRQPVCGSEIEYQPPRHIVPLPLYAPQTGGDNLASRRVGRRYSINPLVTSCHSPYMLRKQGETILPAGSVGSPVGAGLT